MEEIGDEGKYHVETSHGTYYLIDMDRGEYTRTAGAGRNSLGAQNIGQFDSINCRVGEEMHLAHYSGRWVHSTPVTEIIKLEGRVDSEATD